MKALTLWQPWASLVALGVKSIETRSWSTPYRGQLAIHAAKTRPKTYAMQVGDYRCVPLNDGRWSLVHAGSGHVAILPFGQVLAIATLADVVPIDGPNEAGHLRFVCPDIGGGLTRYVFADPWRQPALEEDVTDQRPYGDYSEPGRFAWILDDVRPLAEPVTARGRQQLWTWDAAA